MGLAQLQSALARLYTDASFRERCREDLSSVALESGLTELESSQIRDLLTRDKRLNDFASSLIAKRRIEVAKQLPVTVALLGDPFRPLFAQYAKVAQFSGVSKHQLDAMSFARFAAESPTVGLHQWKREIIRFEALKIRAYFQRSLLRLEVYTYPVARIYASLARNEKDSVRPRFTVVVILRLRRDEPFHCYQIPSN